MAYCLFRLTLPNTSSNQPCFYPILDNSFKRHFWSNLFIILIGWGQLSTVINIESKKNNKEDSFKVMSYNVRLFNVYKWIDNKNTKNEIVDSIKTYNPTFCAYKKFTLLMSYPTYNYPINTLACKAKKSNGEWLHTQVSHHQ